MSAAPDGYGNWAQQYRDRLWSGVLPLPHNRKSPVPEGYSGRKGKIPTDDQITEWIFDRPHGNIALVMPGDVLGIDVDDYAYQYQAKDPKTRRPLTNPDGSPLMVTGVKTGGAVLAALEAELGPLPPTWRSSSRGNGPSGIRFYRVPSGLLWGDLGEHLEGIWWGHRYAVVYPSINPDSGKQYLWIDDTSDRPQWGALPPKVTDLPSLPDSWVARYGRDKDTPKTAPAGPPRRRKSTGASEQGAGPSSTFHGSGGGSRVYTRAQALAYVQPHLDELRSATVGSINNRLNDAAKVLSHFIPAFWTDAQARLMLRDALSATAYDGKSWTADPTIASAFDSAIGDWTAELAPEPLGWVAPTEAILHPTQVRPRPTPPPQEGHDEGSGWPVEPPQDPDPAPDGPGVFWRRREALEQIWTYARSRYTAPWAVLGAVLARAIAAVEPNIKLPAIIGSPASLNLFVALVGPSGGGKDAAAGVAEHTLLVHDGGTAVHTETVPLGSGEGLSHIYMKPPAKSIRRKPDTDDDDSRAIGLGGLDPDQPTQYRTRALVTVAEIDTLTALASRQSATVSGQLRQAAMGDQLGFFYVDTAKRMLVPKHSYRLCLIAGVQPGRAQGLLGETEGGTPQRFLWLPATDPTMTREVPERPDPIAWTPPRYNGPEGLIHVCQQACDLVLDAHIARQRGQGDALDGHALLTRLKVAAALAMLDLGRGHREQCEITDDDWELSGQVMAMSDQTRQAVEGHLKHVKREENERQAHAKARETIVVTETLEKENMTKVLSWLRRKIGTEWVTERELRNASKSTTREHIPEGIDRLVAVGEIEAELYTASHQTARRLRRVGPTLVQNT